MALLSTSTIPADLVPIIDNYWDMASKPVDLMYPKIFKQLKSTDAYYDAVAVAGAGYAAEKPEGSTTETGTITQMGHISHRATTFAKSFQITKEMFVENIAFKRAALLTEALATSLKKTAELNHFNVFNNAFDTGVTWTDGTNLCSTSHGTTGANLSNRSSTDAALSVTSLEQAVIDIANFTDLDGSPASHKAVSVLTPNELMHTAVTIANSMQKPGTANNDVNALNVNGNSMTTMHSSYLTGSTDWFVLTDNTNGFLTHETISPEITQADDIRTLTLIVNGCHRYKAIANDYRAVYGSQGTS